MAWRNDLDLYVLDENENILASLKGFSNNVEELKSFLNKGISQYKK